MLPTGLKPPPKHAPERLRNTADLLVLQRLMTHALVRPLTAGDHMQPRWIDGRAMAKVAGEFIKPNDRLTSFERLELYNRQYWYRLLDNFYDDNPGLRAVLGERKFARLAEAYIAKYPSRSFTLRNLCSRLAQFIRAEPRWTAPHTAIALDLARFEWAQIVAFDEAAKPALAPGDVVSANPARFRVGLQPYVTLLALKHPVDDFVIAVKKDGALRSGASNAFDHAPKAKKTRRVARPKHERVWVAVHRLDHVLYYKRLEPAAFKILGALRDGATIARACAAAMPRKGAAVQGAYAADVERWFKLWIELGWLCRR